MPENTAPDGNTKRSKNADKWRIDFLELWMAGTAGAFFSALARNVPVHLQQISFRVSPDWPYTFDLGVRYAYLVWFIAYFFISNFRRRILLKSDALPPTSDEAKKEIRFVVVQSIVSLGAAFSLDFIAPGMGSPIGSYRWPVGLADAAIVIICLLSLRYWRSLEKDLNKFRYLGLVLSSISLAAVILAPPSFSLLVLLFALVAGLWAMLVWFIVYRITTAPEPSGTSAAQGSEKPAPPATLIPAPKAEPPPLVSSPEATGSPKKENPAGVDKTASTNQVQPAPKPGA